MDDLLSKFNEVMCQTFAAESRLDEEFKKCAQKLEEHISQSIANGTPVQSKKRPKRLDSLDQELDHHDKSSNASLHGASSSNTSSHRQSHRNESIRSKQRSLEEVPEVPAEPQLEESVRPVRTARIKAAKNLKEPALGSKMRQPSIVIKQERISMEVRKDQAAAAADEPMDLDVENDANVLNGVAPLPPDNAAPTEPRKSNDEGFGSTNEKDKEDAPSSREMSIASVPLLVPKVEVLSDDEDVGRMPPPAMPPPSKPVAASAATKSKGRPKKDKSKIKNSEIVPMPIKREKDPEDTSAVSSAESSMSTASNSSRPVRSKKNSQQLPEKIHIKQEKVSTGGKASSSKASTNNHNSPAQSEKSVYEDALEGDAAVRPAAIALTKIVAGAEAEKNRTFALDKNGTFTAAANGTFVVPGDAANGTFNVKSPPNNLVNATFDLPQIPGNSTFVMDSKKNTPDAVNASIMTEDNSHIEESPLVAPAPAAKKPSAAAKKPHVASKPVSKKHVELFSLQSPIKTRIEAFEKAAVSSPMQTRFHGTKTTTPSQPARLLTSKTSTTPLASQRFPLSAKAGTTLATTPTAQNTLPSRGMAASASKLAHLQKKPSATALTKSQSLSREPSMDRGTLSAASSSSSLAIDEKKKKREEKQRLAAQQREQMEKEKREHAERQMREKEEKHRKLLQEREEKQRAELLRKAKKMEEFEKRRHLEELNQRMLADQKRDELAKLEQQQKAERDQAEIFKAKETYEMKLHKQMYQQKMQQHQKNIQAQLQLKKPKAPEPANQVYFSFEMIHTDDSTDDESNDPSKKSKRPPVPSWSSKEERRVAIREQSTMPLAVIDRFFSVRAMTPDLREIFPTIDSRKLKRNSSAVWRTPPRYSQMPKY